MRVWDTLSYVDNIQAAGLRVERDSGQLLHAAFCLGSGCSAPATNLAARTEAVKMNMGRSVPSKQHVCMGVDAKPQSTFPTGEYPQFYHCGRKSELSDATEIRRDQHSAGARVDKWRVRALDLGIAEQGVICREDVDAVGT